MKSRLHNKRKPDPDHRINKIFDLVPGEQYWVCFVRDGRKCHRCQLIAVINENVSHPDDKQTELYFDVAGITHLCWVAEVGMGTTKWEAVSNFRRFNYEDHPSFSDSLQKVSDEYNKTHK